MKRKLVSITDEQMEFIEYNTIDLSKFVQKKIVEEMNKNGRTRS